MTEDTINKKQGIIIQIATSYSKEGTGFYWKKYKLIITNEHIVRDHREVIIEGKNVKRQLTKVLFIDQKNDLAFLEAPTSLQSVEADLVAAESEKGETVIALGHPFGEQFSSAKGKVSEVEDYLTHDAVLSSSYNGGPLLNLKGELLGINAFLQKKGQYFGIALTAKHIIEGLLAFQLGNGEKGSRCMTCENIIFENSKATKYCPNCGGKIRMLSMIEDYEPNGIPKTVEDILTKIGHDVKITRRGPSNWEIQEGSATVRISYHEESGLIIGDAYLCMITKKNTKAIYQYLLQQNRIIEGLTFSIKPQGNDIILSLLIYDRYLNVDTGMKLFQHLFERADYYDNILVEEYEAVWKTGT